VVSTADDTTVTEISVVGANCPWCFTDTLDALRREPSVVSAAASLAGQCIRVEHHGAAPERLLDVVREHLHGDGLASMEQVMVAVDPQLAELHCTHHAAPRPEPDASARRSSARDGAEHRQPRPPH
jgi:hypothetical protein